MPKKRSKGSADSRDAGFDRHLAKPASIDRLEALLAEAPAEAVTPLQSGR